MRSLLPPLLLDDGGSVLTVGLEGEVEGGGGGGKSDGWVVVGRRLRLFFVFFFFGAVVALLLEDDDREAAAPPSDPYPSQSGKEIQPSSRYALSGLAGTLEGRCPLLLHSFHSFAPRSFSFRAYARPAAKGSMRLCAMPPLPSQSGQEIQPSLRYVSGGEDGISEGR